jgi:anti-anti-sigma factor
MATKPLEVEVSAAGRVAIIRLAGEIDGFADEPLRQAFAAATAAPERPAALLLHLGSVEYINSSGIGVLVSLLMLARQAGLPVLACGLSDHYRHIFEITRLAQFIQHFPDEATALAQAPA